MKPTPEKMLKTLGEINKKLAANRDIYGHISDGALHRRLLREERDIAIALSGLPPETPADPYAASTGEFLAALRDTE